MKYPSGAKEPNDSQNSEWGQWQEDGMSVSCPVTFNLKKFWRMDWRKEKKRQSGDIHTFTHIHRKIVKTDLRHLSRGCKLSPREYGPRASRWASPYRT